MRIAPAVYFHPFSSARKNNCNTIILTLALLALLALAAGCAQPKQPDRVQASTLDEATQKAMTRTYEGFTREQLIDAAEKALTHSDRDYKVTHRKDGFSATRHWLLSLVTSAMEGNDSWDVKVDGSKIKATAWYAGGSVGLSGAVGIPAKSAAEYYLSPPLYDLFFDRMEYFLGLRSDWAPCVNVDAVKFHRTDGLRNGGNDPLCFMAKSQDPAKAK